VTDSTADCPFCAIAAGTAPATVVREWPDALAIVPLHPVVDGHTLVIPKIHVADFAENPRVTATTMFRAAELAWDLDQPMNLITSKGREASQSVWHLHAHLIPRAEGDGLALPWYSGKRKARSADPEAPKCGVINPRQAATCIDPPRHDDDHHDAFGHTWPRRADDKPLFASKAAP
jgi:histidine triad (HIT) family protein